MRLSIQMLYYITAISLGVTLASAQDKISHPYYPMSVGIEWQYDFNSGTDGWRHYRTVEKTIGDTLFYIKRHMIVDLVTVAIVWEKLLVRKSGVYQVAFKGMDDPDYVKMNPQKLVLPLPLKVGFKWKYKDEKYEVIGHCRDITGSTGTFKDCYVIQTENLTSELSKFKNRDYYARDYGLVVSSAKNQSAENNWIWGLSLTKKITP